MVRPMDERPPPPTLDYHKPPRRPWWVSTGLAGIPSRRAALAWLAGTALLALAVGAFWWPVGLSMLLAPLWYWRAIRWVDRNDHW